MAKGDLDDPIYYILSDGTKSTYGSINSAGIWKVSPGLALGAGEVSSEVLRTIEAGDSIVSVYARNPVAQGDSATALRIVHAGDVVASVYAQNPVSQGDAATALRVVVAGNSDVSVTATQTGTWTVTVANSNNTTATNIVDSTGVVFSGSNPLPITGNVNVNGSLNSVISEGPLLHDAVDDGSKPLKVGGVAITANPTAVAGGDVVRFVGDKIGRQIVVPYQVRDLIKTAYVSISNGTETTLLAGVAGVFFDLISLSASTTSTFGVSTLVPPYVDIRCTRGSGVVASLPIGGLSATNTGAARLNTLVMSAPIPQDEADSSWTVDMNDITGTTVNIQALFIRNI